MDIEKSLTQDEMIKELIGLLKANQMGDKANDLYETQSEKNKIEKFPRTDKCEKLLTNNFYIINFPSCCCRSSRSIFECYSHI